MIRIYLTLLCSVFMFGLQAQKIVDKVVAQIGSEYILLSDVEKQFAYLSESQGVIDEDARCEILENLLAQKIMIHQARIDSIAVGPEEVEAQLNYRIESILTQMNGNEELFVQYYGQTVDEVKTWMRSNMEDMMLAERMQMSLFDKISITPSETKAFFEMIPKDSLPFFNAEVEVAEIVSVPKVNEIEKKKALEKAEMILKMIIDEEETFEMLAEKYSDDPGSKRLGGDLGWQKRGTFVPEFEAAAYSMEKGEISEPIETDFGYHIIQLLGRRGNTIQTRHILIKPDITQADIDLAKSKLDAIKTEIESDSISFTNAIKKYSNKNAESYNNNGRLTNPANGTTFFETGDLPPDIYFAIEGLEVGEITEPIEYLSPQNVTEFRIIKLLSKTKPHRANLKQDYSKIQFFAKENKKNEYFATWIQDKASKTYFKIDEAYQTCPNMVNWGNTEE